MLILRSEGESPSFTSTLAQRGRLALIYINIGSTWASRPHSKTIHNAEALFPPTHAPRFAYKAMQEASADSRQTEGLTIHKKGARLELKHAPLKEVADYGPAGTGVVSTLSTVTRMKRAPGPLEETSSITVMRA